MEKNNIIGNTTTIITTISLSFSGLVLGILASRGIHLGVDQQTLAGIIGTILMALFGYFNAKYHCDFFNDLTVDVTGLTDAQVNSIESFVDNARTLNENNNLIEDIDPASRYEDDEGC